jgi:tRNA (guanine26-N2/guanine27-N2)-dimethyltransferase
MGFVSYCPSCCFRIAGRLPLEKKCPECSHQLMHGGPLWLGRLWDATILEMMVALNAKRGYGTRNFRKNFSAVGNPMGFTTTKAGLVEKMLRTQLAESKVEAYGYYDLHVLARKLKGKIASMDRALETIRASGFAAERTHFCPTAIRTDAPHMEIARMVKGE